MSIEGRLFKHFVTCPFKNSQQKFLFDPLKCIGVRNSKINEDTQVHISFEKKGNMEML